MTSHLHARALHRAISAAAITAFLIAAHRAAATTVSSFFAEPGTFTFTGPSTIESITATTTTESLGVTTPVAPTIIYPELDPAVSEDQPAGFALDGRYDFVNGTGTAAQLEIIAQRPVTLTTGSLAILSQLDGASLGIDSADFTPPITGGAEEPAAGTLASFTVTTTIQGLPPVAGQANDIASDGTTGTIDVTPNFPDGALLSTGPLEAENLDTTAGDYELEQDTIIDFSDLVPGESVDVLLPEPTTTTFALAAIAGLLTRRPRGRRAHE